MLNHKRLKDRLNRSIVLLAFIFLQAACSITPESFSYPVRVVVKDSGLPIANASVTLDVPDKAPLNENTDTNGYTRITVGAAYTDRPGVLRVEATGYRPYIKNIDLTKAALPELIELEPTAGSATPAPAVTETSTAPTVRPSAGPAATTPPAQATQSDALPPIDWGGLDHLFIITDLKLEHHKPVANVYGSVAIVDNALTFVVEAKSDFSLIGVCKVSFFDSAHIQVDSASIVSFDPALFSWTKGDRSHGLIILPLDMSQIQTIAVAC